MILWIVALPSLTLAQDEVTEIPTETSVVVSDDGGGLDGDIVVETGDDVTVNLITIVVGLLSAFAAGGLVGIVGISQYVNRIKDDVSTVTAIEKLADSYPPDTKQLVHDIFLTLQNVGSLGMEVFDGVPIAGKTLTAQSPDDEPPRYKVVQG